MSTGSEKIGDTTAPAVDSSIWSDEPGADCGLSSCVAGSPGGTDEDLDNFDHSSATQ